jgi:hypothetical protein
MHIAVIGTGNGLSNKSADFPVAQNFSELVGCKAHARHQQDYYNSRKMELCFPLFTPVLPINITPDKIFRTNPY